MRTEDLVEALAGEIRPVRPVRAPILPLLAGAVIAVMVVWIVLGPRPDLTQAIWGPTFWLKAAYTLALAGAALWLTDRLGRPGAAGGLAAATLAGVVVVAAVAAGLEQAALAGGRLEALLGQSWSQCPLLIVGVAIVTGPAIFAGARRFAPTRPAIMGAAVGVLTGGIAATAYSLHCPEQTASFVAVWYTLGVAGAGAIGALAGHFALRW
ncbi:MAG: NrsF family protein [Brevundimonas sp.]|jgi:hypothetical protein|uniref:NrsF family protein n=1 Tax=Brevundimonas sp. TaxID=1871086 RepID=UPI0022C0BA8C|nr:DUF1109 domain-containing protein [Brevundimonas sp.]